MPLAPISKDSHSFGMELNTSRKYVISSKSDLIAWNYEISLGKLRDVKALTDNLDGIKQIKNSVAILLKVGVVGLKERPYLKEVVAHLGAGVDGPVAYLITGDKQVNLWHSYRQNLKPLLISEPELFKVGELTSS